MQTTDSIFEVEFKYRADHITLSDFLNIIVKYNRLDNIKITSPAGDDFYFEKLNSKDEFKRLRIDSDEKKAELTYKKKLDSLNSWKRLEIDLDLKLEKGQSKDLIEKVTEYSTNTGFYPVFKIHKKSFIVKLERFVYAFYIVDGQDFFIELEARKDVFKEKDEAFKALEDEERVCLGKLGISKDNRINENLYELYRKIKKCP